MLANDIEDVEVKVDVYIEHEHIYSIKEQIFIYTHIVYVNIF